MAFPGGFYENPYGGRQPAGGMPFGSGGGGDMPHSDAAPYGFCPHTGRPNAPYGLCPNTGLPNLGPEYDDHFDERYFPQRSNRFEGVPRDGPGFVETESVDRNPRDGYQSRRRSSRRREPTRSSFLSGRHAVDDGPLSVAFSGGAYSSMPAVASANDHARENPDGVLIDLDDDLIDLSSDVYGEGPFEPEEELRGRSLSRHSYERRRFVPYHGPGSYSRDRVDDDDDIHGDDDDDHDDFHDDDDDDVHDDVPGSRHGSPAPSAYSSMPSSMHRSFHGEGPRRLPGPERFPHFSELYDEYD